MPAKWIDNVLSHHSINGVAKSRQGVARRLTPQALLSLEIAIRLSQAFSIPTGRAIQLAEEQVRQLPESAAGKGVALTIDMESIRSELGERLAHAVEIAPLPKRGRPAKQ
jgi:hypothetical protein